MSKCHSCQNDARDKYYCESCGVIHNERKQKQRDERFNAGLCTICGGENNTDKLRCSKCQDKKSNSARQRKAEGKCNILKCENPKLIKSIFCEYHRLAHMSYRKERCIRFSNKGLCTICSREPYMDCYKDKSVMTKKCRFCTLKQNEKTRQKYKERFENGLCVSCGEKRDSQLTLCLVCRDKQNGQQKVRLDGRFIDGRCSVFDCKNQRLINNKCCEIHRIKRLEQQHKRAIKLVGDGLCTLCGKEPFLECFKNKKVINKLCLEHYLKQRANVRFHNTGLWINLLEKLKEQNYKCFYTGQTITLGVDDSIDHILATSRFPEKKDDVANIQWVSRDVNWMKDNFTHEEFMNLIEKIYKYRKEMEKGKKVPSPSP